MSTTPSAGAGKKPRISMEAPRREKISLADMYADDAVGKSPQEPAGEAKGKSEAKSLLYPQPLARNVLPAEDYQKLLRWATHGVPAECGDPWPDEVIARALEAGPHTSALTPEGVKLLWEDVAYQEEAGFVRLKSESALFGGGIPSETKISRVAVVPQANRRDRIILNLSAQVVFPDSRRKPGRVHPSVNETTVPAEDQEAVRKLGNAARALLMYMFECPPDWEIQWQKIDLSDGFWRMIVEAGKEGNFIFQMPPRPGDTERYFVVPSALQMGWTNSPAYFCTATDITLKLALRVLALSVGKEIMEPHRYEDLCVAAREALKGIRGDGTFLLQVFVDDFMNALGGHPHRASKVAEQRWITRGSMHSIHSTYPPPEITGHQGGKDSISSKKVNKGDALFEISKEMLGLLLRGGTGKDRTVGLPANKRDRYVAAIDKALISPAYRLSKLQLQSILGKIQFASLALPAMRGYLTPINRAMVGKGEKDFIGLGKASELREVLTDLRTMLGWAHDRPSHISELVPCHLPHYYGTVDASGVGFGGTFLPCTRWMQPGVWRLALPADLSKAVTEGTLTMVDCEFAGYFIWSCLLTDLLKEEGLLVAGMNSHCMSDNSPTVGIVNRQATRALSPMPSRALRWLAYRQRFMRLGPQSIEHVAGETNTMADFPSRCYEQGYTSGAKEDERFLQEFTNRYPLPPQLKSWRLVRPRPEICSAAYLLLRKIKDGVSRVPGPNGEPGVDLPAALASTLTYQASKGAAGTWNEATCSWPLLRPCGKACSTSDLPLARKLRERFESVDRYWQAEDLRTLGDQIRARPN